MAVFHVKNSGTKTTGASTPDDWTNANCYASLETGSAALTDGDEMILDDDTFVITSILTGIKFDNAKTWSSRGSNAANCIVDFQMTTSNGVNMNTAVASSTLVLNNITFKRTTAVTGQYVMFQASSAMTDVTYNNCKFDDITCTLPSGSNDLGLIAYGAVSTSRVFTFNACDFSNIRLSGGTGGVVIGRFRTGTVRFIGGCTFNRIHGSYDGATHRAFIWADGADIQFGDTTSRISISNVTSIQTATNAHRSFIQCIASVDVKIYNVDISGCTWTGGTAGAILCYAAFTYEVEDVVATDCISTPSTGDNSTGGIFLATTVNATGTYKNVSVTRCTGDFGPAYYASDGAEGTLENVVAANCTCKHGAIYTGGYGDFTGYGLLVYGTTRRAGATASQKGQAFYGHNHVTTSTRNKTITLAGCTFVDNTASAGNVDGCRFNNENLTYSLTVQMDNCIIGNGGVANEEIFGDGAGATTYNTDFCSVEGGAAATSGFTNANLQTWADTNLEDRANNNYELSSDSALLNIGKITNNLKQSANGNPFPGFDIDIGGLQSIYGPFHPRQLNGPSIINSSTFMTSTVGRVLEEAHERRIDILAIGDSNQAFGGIGWDHGMQFALSKTFGLYATGILTTGESGGAGQALGYYAAGGDRDAAAAETGAPTVLDNYMDGNLFPQNYSYLAAATFVQGFGLFLTTPSTEDPFNVLNEDFKIHYCYGTFDAGAGSFTPGIRLEKSPWTNYVTGSPISTNTGVEEVAFTSLNSGVGPRPDQIACRFGHVGTTVTAPYLSYFWRGEIEARTFGISYTSMYSLGGTSMYDMAAAFIAAHDNSILLNLSEARRLQESAGYSPKIVMMVNAGINDRNETSTPSLGPDAIIDPDSAEAYVDNFKALVSRVESVWNANYSDGGIYWMVVPSHPISDPDDAELISYRLAMEVYAATVPNIDSVDISTLTNFNEMTSSGWYDGGGPEHLTELGYEQISRKIFNY